MLGNLYIIAAPSGAGKTSLVSALVQSQNDIQVSISHTTRQPRPGEVEGENYFFIKEDDFLQKVKNNEFLEYAEVFGNYYGTSKAWVLSQLKLCKDVILEIDWQGARQVKEKFPHSIGIFLLPPSLEILHNRLQSRAQDNPDTIEARMTLANAEMSHYQEYEYLIINDSFEEALLQLRSIIIAHRCLLLRQTQRYKLLIEGLTC